MHLPTDFLLWSGTLGLSYMPGTPLTSCSLEDGKFGRLFESSEWVVTCTSEVSKHPHVWATMCTGIDADE